LECVRAAPLSETPRRRFADIEKAALRARTPKRFVHVVATIVAPAGAWRDGIVARHGMEPQIEYYEVFGITDNARGAVELFEEQRSEILRLSR
jgi:hypothetical protein